ncbi:MAG TPA: hypothetical protein PLQ12_10615, partial [Candidatus Defluviicoccus seviourii]|nr:hypothetical protein [Candidatus Defluviicoccus seviourii]
GESADCRLLDDLWALLSTGKRMDFDDTIEPTFRLAIAPLPFLLWHDREPDLDRKPDYYEVLTIIRHGGPWHGDAMGGAGPAAYSVVERPTLIKFFYDLLDEALDPKNSDEASRRILMERFGEAIDNRPETR